MAETQRTCQVCDLCGRLVEDGRPAGWTVLTDAKGQFVLACSPACVNEGWLRYMMVPALADEVGGEWSGIGLAPFPGPPVRNAGEILPISPVLGEALGRWRVGEAGPVRVSHEALGALERELGTSVPAGVLAVLGVAGRSPAEVGTVARRAWGIPWDMRRRLVPFAETAGDFWCFERGRSDEVVAWWSHDTHWLVDLDGQTWSPLPEVIVAFLGEPLTDRPPAPVSGVVLT